jgi:hypothetical protein
VELRWAWGTGASLTNFIWAVQARSQMLWNFATIATFVAVLGSRLFMLMTDREGFLTDREKVSGISGGPLGRQRCGTDDGIAPHRSAKFLRQNR